MSDGETGTSYTVWERKGDGPEARAGRVSYSAGFFTVLDAEGRSDVLLAAVDRVNAKAAISRMTPPGAGTGRYALGMETVDRSSPGFEDAAREHLLTYYGLRLA